MDRSIPADLRRFRSVSGMNNLPSSKCDQLEPLSLDQRGPAPEDVKSNRHWCQKVGNNRPGPKTRAFDASRSSLKIIESPPGSVAFC